MSPIGAKRALLGRSRGNLLAWDSFSRIDGAIGRTEVNKSARSKPWTGATWTISGNKAINTPVPGEELAVDGGLETWTDATLDNWPASGSPTIAKEDTDIHGGSFAIDFTANAGHDRVQQSLAGQTTGDWYLISAWGKRLSGTTGETSIGCGNLMNLAGGAGDNYSPAFTDAVYTKKVLTGQAVATTIYPRVVHKQPITAAYDNVLADDFSIKKLTLSELISSLSDNGTPSVLASVSLTSDVNANAQSGLVTNLDSAASPANFLLAIYTDTNAILKKCVGGTYTTLISAAATYGAGYVLRLHTYRSGANLMANLTYNGVAVGTEQTISDAGIIDNTIHGMFSTYEGNTLDNYSLKKNWR